GKDLRVDEHDVHHSEKRRDAGDKFRAHVAAALVQAEMAIEERLLAHSLCCVGHVTSQPVVRSVPHPQARSPKKRIRSRTTVARKRRQTQPKPRALAICPLARGCGRPRRTARALPVALYFRGSVTRLTYRCLSLF